MITSVSKGVFIVLVFCFIYFFFFLFSFFFLIYLFWYRQGRTGVGREVGWFYKNGNKKREKKKEEKRPQKVWQSAKGWMSMICF